eukprot:3776206-Pleurochrysis_carterae.AAC.1
MYIRQRNPHTSTLLCARRAPLAMICWSCATSPVSAHCLRAPSTRDCKRSTERRRCVQACRRS